MTNQQRKGNQMTHADRSAARYGSLLKAGAYSADESIYANGFDAGFNKAAEIIGVSPAALVKRAKGFTSDFRDAADTLRGAHLYGKGVVRMADPANIASAGGLVTGGALLHSALTGDKTTASRVLRGIAGTGFAAGGMVAALDSGSRDAIRRFVMQMLGKADRAVSGIGR